MKEHIAHSGAWGIALIAIVVASWLLYRYLAPKTWKEWASAGVVQAFINPHFPALRSGPTAAPGASLQKQIPSSPPPGPARGRTSMKLNDLRQSSPVQFHKSPTLPLCILSFFRFGPTFLTMKTTRMILVSITLALATIVNLHADESKPFKGKAHSIPGLIEAEHWDEGKAGIAYHDIDEKNQGENYREETQVDIEKRPDASNGHGVGWTKKGEWLVYTVNVTESGIYSIEIPVASKKKGGVFHIEMNGKDVTGPINVPDTGSWQTLKLVTHKNVKLEKGAHLMKVVMDSEGESTSIGDIDYFKFVK